MYTRNYSASAITNIKKAQTAANFYSRATQVVLDASSVAVQQLSQTASPQTGNNDADTINTIQAGQQAYYFTGNLITTVIGPGQYRPISLVPTLYTIVPFTTIGASTWQAPALTTSVTYLLLGGGGGGGGAYDGVGGGGGGGGTIVTGILQVTPMEFYTITVGDGGVGGSGEYTTVTSYNGANGDPSIFAGISAAGGGGGGRSHVSPGGTGGARSLGGAGGNSGGPLGGGGGGGAGGPGVTATRTIGELPGPGVPYSLSGRETYYGAGGVGGNGGFNGTYDGPDAVPPNSGNGGGGASANTQSPQGDLVFGGKGASGLVLLTFYQ